MSRQFVHLTAGELEDVKSGYRHDATVKIYVDLRQMAADDISIYQSSNDVILI